LIQRFAGCDSIVAPKPPLADFCNNIGHNLPRAPFRDVALIICAMGIYAAGLWSLPTGFLTGSAAAGIALINSIGNLGGFVGLCRPVCHRLDQRCDWRNNAGLVVLAACLIMAGVVTLLMGHNSKIEMAGSRMMAD
jgi:ACS family tartrate transporter-like MFS transporter